MPKFRKKYSKSKPAPSSKLGSDAKGYQQEKEDRVLRSSSLSYKDDIDSV